MVKVKKQVCIYIVLFLISLIKVDAQSVQLIPLSQEEIEKQSVVPGIYHVENEKVMACAGNAANNNFANAQSLTVNGGNVAGTTCGTLEGGETIACYTGADQSVWYKFVATATTHYVQISYVSGGCYFGSAVYSATALPTSACGNSGPISCQSASGGPLVHLYQLTNLTIGNTYYIQVMYNAGGVCGTNGTFNIQVTTGNPGGTVTNKPDINTCATAQPGCFFPSPPTVNTVTSTCTSYPLAAAGYNANSVMTLYQTFTSSASWSNFSWQAIITSNCGAGNVVWLNWALYNCSCGELACGDISTLTGNGLACGTCYILKYQFELANCTSFTTIWPYQNVPSSPIACTVLPLHLLYFTADPAQDGKKVNIEWETVSEENIKEFKVERSDDAVNFKTIAIVPAKGNNGGEQTHYNCEDACCTSQATRYYKLSAIENDGSTSYEKMIAVTFKGNIEITKFSPNPANTNFIISFGEDALNLSNKLVMYNSVGKVVKEVEFVSDTFYKQFNIEELPSGIYFINLITPASSEIVKYKLVKE